MNDILFSVITVVRNDAFNIKRTIESVLGQKRELFEYIIVDGLSIDGTTDIIEEYIHSVDQFVSETDTGIYNAMNKGAKMAKGAFLIFMNCGDEFADGRVLEIVSECKQIDSADVIYGDVLIKNDNMNLVVKSSGFPQNYHRMYFCHQSSFIRKSCMHRYLFDETYKMSADFKQMKLLYLSGASFLRLDYPIAHFDKRGISNTQRVKGLQENISIIRECDRGFSKVRLLFRIMPSFLVARFRSKALFLSSLR